MPHTTSISFPTMFDVARNRVAVLEDDSSVRNRVMLLLLTEPTELFNNPTQGGGLKRYMFQYNTENTKAMVQARIKDQLRAHEPSVTADETSFLDGLPFSNNSDIFTTKSSVAGANKFELTVGLVTVYGDTVELTINDTDVDSSSTSTSSSI